MDWIWATRVSMIRLTSLFHELAQALNCSIDRRKALQDALDGVTDIGKRTSIQLQLSQPVPLPSRRLLLALLPRSSVSLPCFMA